MIIADLLSYAILFWWSTAALHASPEAVRWRQVASTAALVSLKVFAFCGMVNSVMLPHTMTWWGRGTLYSCAVIAVVAYDRRFGIVAHVRMAAAATWTLLNRPRREPHS